MAAQLIKFIKNYTLKQVNFMVFKLYFNKVVSKRKKGESLVFFGNP